MIHDMPCEIKRREMLRLAGAGFLAALLPDGEIAAQSQTIHAAKYPSADLMKTAKKTAATSGTVDESYFWPGLRTLMFLRRVPGKTVFEAVLVDALTGRQTVPQAFNDKNSQLMEGGRMSVSYGDSRKSEMNYLPPRAALSPNGKWLLWTCDGSSNGVKRWFASALDGLQEKWPQGSDPASEFPGFTGHGLWMPDSRHWVELITRYAKGTYSNQLAHEYVLGKSSPVRTVRISGLGDGLAVGIRQDRVIVIHTPSQQLPDRSDVPVRHLELSLVGLDADAVTARKLNLPIPESYDVADVTLSPKGDRLAWILKRGSDITGLYTLYVADADGAHSRPLGSAEMVKTGRTYSWPRGLRWLPDGKQVSFTYKGAIYTIPV